MVRWVETRLKERDTAYCMSKSVQGIEGEEKDEEDEEDEEGARGVGAWESKRDVYISLKQHHHRTTIQAPPPPPSQLPHRQTCDIVEWLAMARNMLQRIEGGRTVAWSRLCGGGVCLN
jgi:hypothetical protein